VLISIGIVLCKDGGAIFQTSHYNISCPLTVSICKQDIFSSTSNG